MFFGWSQEWFECDSRLMFQRDCVFVFIQASFDDDECSLKEEGRHAWREMRSHYCNIVWDETIFEINELTLLLFFRFPTSSCHKYSSIKPVNLLYSLQQSKNETSRGEIPSTLHPARESSDIMRIHDYATFSVCLCLWITTQSFYCIKYLNRVKYLIKKVHQFTFPSLSPLPVVLLLLPLDASSQPTCRRMFWSWRSRQTRNRWPARSRETGRADRRMQRECQANSDTCPFGIWSRWDRQSRRVRACGRWDWCPWRSSMHCRSTRDWFHLSMPRLDNWKVRIENIKLLIHIRSKTSFQLTCKTCNQESIYTSLVKIANFPTNHCWAWTLSH